MQRGKYRGKWGRERGVERKTQWERKWEQEEPGVGKGGKQGGGEACREPSIGPCPSSTNPVLSHPSRAHIGSMELKVSHMLPILLN